MLLSDRVAVVAGGSKGIGRAVSKCFALQGASVVVVARGKRDVEDAVAEIQELGGHAVGIQADCTRKQDVDAVVGQVVQEFGTVDVLVNNIGGGQPELLLNTGDDLYQSMLDINIKATFLVTRAVAPLMVKQRYGKIINTSSIGAKTPTPGLALYDGCKAFIVAFTRDLALELGPHNINVNCVCPGHIPTEAADEVGIKLAQINNMDAMQLKGMAMARMAVHKFPTPDDIARLYLFLATRDSDCMTGQALNFSCGMEMR